MAGDDFVCHMVNVEVFVFGKVVNLRRSSHDE